MSIRKGKATSHLVVSIDALHALIVLFDGRGSWKGLFLGISEPSDGRHRRRIGIRDDPYDVAITPRRGDDVVLDRDRLTTGATFHDVGIRHNVLGSLRIVIVVVVECRLSSLLARLLGDFAPQIT